MGWGSIYNLLLLLRMIRRGWQRGVFRGIYSSFTLWWMIQKGWREGIFIHPSPCDAWFKRVGGKGYLFVLHLVMNDSEGLEGGGIYSGFTLSWMIQRGWSICPSPCDEWFRGVGGRSYLSFTLWWMIQRGWREGVFVLHLVMNDSDGLEGGGICPSPCDEWFGAREYLSFTLWWRIWREGVFVLHLVMNDLKGGGICPSPCDGWFEGRGYLSFTLWWMIQRGCRELIVVMFVCFSSIHFVLLPTPLPPSPFDFVLLMYFPVYMAPVKLVVLIAADVLWIYLLLWYGTCPGSGQGLQGHRHHCLPPHEPDGHQR